MNFQNMKLIIQERWTQDFDDSCFKEANARLRGWQRYRTA
ncbi:hypothetical protein VCG_000750 [Vibrio cholerae 12129(1)]|nr:hypothetical protein VCG_000750 [Vibrio cholerae 12129(1)]